MPRPPPSGAIIKAYLSAMFRKEHQGLDEGGYRALGERYGIAHTTIANLINHQRQGGGLETQMAYASVHFGNSLDRFYEAVEKWREKEGIEEPEEIPAWRKTAPRFPRMVPALEMGLDSGLERGFLDLFAGEGHRGADDDETDAATWWIRLQGAWSTRRTAAGAKDPHEAAESAKGRPPPTSERTRKPRRR